MVAIEVPIHNPIRVQVPNYHILSTIVTYITILSQTRVPNYRVLWTLRVSLGPQNYDPVTNRVTIRRADSRMAALGGRKVTCPLPRVFDSVGFRVRAVRLYLIPE